VNSSLWNHLSISILFYVDGNDIAIFISYYFPNSWNDIAKLYLLHVEVWCKKLTGEATTEQNTFQSLIASLRMVVHCFQKWWFIHKIEPQLNLNVSSSIDMS
jgi:hypothetical protein